MRIADSERRIADCGLRISPPTESLRLRELHPAFGPQSAIRNPHVSNAQ